MNQPMPLSLPALPHRPLVSVLIANYNHAAFVGKAIESVLGQTYQNFEVVVCDDGSTDNSLDVLRNFADLDSRVKIVAKSNGGQASALNAAYTASRGEVIAILDSDDEWYAQRLERCIESLMSHPMAGIVGHPQRVIREDGVVIRPVHPIQQDEGWLASYVLMGFHPRFAAASGITLRREVAQIVFPLPEEFRMWADRLLVERCALVTQLVAVREVLADYRQHSSNLTGFAGPANLSQIKKHLEVDRKLMEFHRSFAESLGHTAMIDLPTMINNSSGSIKCAEALLEGRKLTFREIDLLCGSSARTAIFWKIINILPNVAGVFFYRLWRSDNFISRIARKRFSPSGW